MYSYEYHIGPYMYGQSGIFQPLCPSNFNHLCPSYFNLFCRNYFSHFVEAISALLRKLFQPLFVEAILIILSKLLQPFCRSSFNRSIEAGPTPRSTQPSVHLWLVADTGRLMASASSAPMVTMKACLLSLDKHHPHPVLGSECDEKDHATHDVQGVAGEMNIIMICFVCLPRSDG